MAFSLISNHDSNSTTSSRESKRKRKRIIGTDNRIEELTIDGTKWKTESELQIYSSKLVQALSQGRRSSSFPATLPCRALAVRDTADRVLAVRAKGRTRWSRAILRSRLRFRINISKHKKAKKVNVIGGDENSAVKRTLGPLQRKVRVLGRLVPGCRKLSFPNLLEEATDYISALKMQVRALTALNGLVTGAGGSLAAPAEPRGSSPLTY